MKRIQLQRFVLIAAMAFGCFSTHANAKNYLGAHLGYVVPSADNTTSRFGYGIQGGTFFTDLLSMGLDITQSSKSETGTRLGTNYSVNAKFMTIMAEANFWMFGLYFGPRVGIAKSSGSATIGTFTVGASSTDLTLGAQAGYEMSLGPIGIGPKIAFHNVMATSSYSLLDLMIVGNLSF